MLSLDENDAISYPKIWTLYERDDKWKVDTSKLIKPEFGLIDKWLVTEKIDGVNVRIVWKNSKFYILGRTGISEVPKDLEYWMRENIKFEEFPKLFGDKETILYGEGFAGKIQSGQVYGDVSKFILFDVKIDGFFLNRSNIENVAENLGLDVVPILGFMSLEDITNMAKNGYRSSIGSANKPCEGIVAKTDPNLYDNQGRRLIFKLKYKDFARVKTTKHYWLETVTDPPVKVS